jgi:ankyrin repeat protein
VYPQVDVNMVDDLERTALMIAIEEGHESTVAQLFNRANLHFNTAVDQNTRMVLNGLTNTYVSPQFEDESNNFAAAVAATDSDTHAHAYAHVSLAQGVFDLMFLFALHDSAVLMCCLVIVVRSMNHVCITFANALISIN